jgi:hypothetical protein
MVELLDAARRTSARAVNTVMTATYWEVGRRIVEHEQGGSLRATYGKALIERLSHDLTARFGRGFSVDNLELFRTFYRAYPLEKSESSIRKFPLPWTHYVHLLRRSRSREARAFYEAEALRGGWSVRQLDRQIGSQF